MLSTGSHYAPRGQPGNRQLMPGLSERALRIIRERCAVFGPTLACEKLAEVHGQCLAKATTHRLAARRLELSDRHCHPSLERYSDMGRFDFGRLDGNSIERRAYSLRLSKREYGVFSLFCSPQRLFPYYNQHHSSWCGQI